MFKYLLLLLVLSFAVFAEDRVFLEKTVPESLPAGWSRTTPFAITQSSQRTIEAIFALRQRNLDILDQTFWAVSTPGNPRYGQHLTLEQITDLIAPVQSDIDAVVEWLNDNGVTDVQVILSKDFIRAKMTTVQASKLFKIQFHNYRHVDGMSIDTSVGPYSVPVELAGKIDFISGIVGFPDIDTPKYKANPAPSIGQNIVPTVIRARYNVSADLVVTNSKNSHAVAEFQAQYYSPSDLSQFWKSYVPFAPEQTVAQVVGYNNANNPGIEASLDIEYIMGVAPGATTWFYSQKNFNFWNDLTSWITILNNESNVPWVHSVSYGSQGDYPSESYRERLDTEFQKVGTRGVSIIFASGDSGAGCEGRGALSHERACDCTFYPSFPATCPYITSVGATAFINGNTGPEEAVYLFKSGGGFSQIFSIPDYQADSVSDYFNSGVQLPESCAYNASGRGTPDVAALGDEHFQVVNGGETISVGGTSASAPTFAAIITFLNDIRLNNNKATLGFLNPFLYTAASTPGAFFDVTQGNNMNSRCCVSGKNDGFNCAAGWDPVTGLGTPNFDVLKTLV